VVRLLEHKKATEHRDACRMILCGGELGCLLHGVKSVVEAVLRTHVSGIVTYDQVADCTRRSFRRDRGYGSGINAPLSLESPVVSIRTTCSAFSNSAFCPHRVFVCFVWI
jgi:hypothetical protein